MGQAAGSAAGRRERRGVDVKKARLKEDGQIAEAMGRTRRDVVRGKRAQAAGA